MEEKIKKLQDATMASQRCLLEAELKLTSASHAVEVVKRKLKQLSPEAQQNLEFNDTELPDLISAKMLAESECDAARIRYETNKKYLMIMREKHSESS
jgi:osmotically-inducible protein OsmY